MAAPLTAADVYALQLYRLGHGYPLWDPNPPKGEPFIGDVGFISQGTFHRIFNALEPKDDGANKLAPHWHEPFSFATEFSKVKTVDAITQSVLPSRTMSHFSVKVRAAESSEHVGAGFRFQCSGDQGAVLFMKQSADHEYVHESRAMVEYISRHLARWHEYIRDVVDVNVAKEALRFIAGFHKTADWAVASYVSTGRLAEIELNTDFGLASAAFSVAAGTTVAPVLEQRWGPPPRTAVASGSDSAAGPADERNQCVFINYYKLKWRLGVFPRVMKAAAGYDELPRGPHGDADGGRACIEGGSDGEEMDEIETDRPSFQCWDPVDFVLDYILENEANVEVAIANDRDINRLCEQLQCEIPDDIPLFLETIKPQIAVTEDGLGMLHHDGRLLARSSVPEQVAPMSIDEASSSRSGTAPADRSYDTTGGPSGSSGDMNMGGLDEEEEGPGGPGIDAVIKLEHRRDDDSEAASVTALAYSPNGRYIASGGDDALVIIWDAKTGHRLHTCDEHSDTVYCLAFSPDSRKLVSGSGDRLAIVYDVQTGHAHETLTGHLDTVYSVAWSRNGAFIATGSVDTTVKLWDADSGQERPLASDDSAIVLIVAFSPDSRRLVSSSADYCTRVWSVPDGILLNVLGAHQGIVNALAYASDSRRLVTGSDDGSARIWDADMGLELVELREHSGSVWAVAFSPDGTRLLSAASDGSVRIHDSYGGERMHEIDAGDTLVTAVAFSPDGARICASSADNTIRVWDANTATQVATLISPSEQVTHLKVSPDAMRVISSSDDGLMYIWMLDNVNAGGQGATLVEA